MKISVLQVIKMPYYCTVPRCTSMAGKAKNVSFHQFPRDEELARLWNKILKRGKPYTKYSKVCSLHFRPEDYTITSVGKNKGQWRTLRKDAIPSQNLPLESPGPTTPRTHNTGSWVPSLPPNVLDTSMQQQMAQAIYMQTMLAMQAATNGTPSVSTQSSNASNSIDSSLANTSSPPTSELDQFLQKHNSRNEIERLQVQEDNSETLIVKKEVSTSYKCEECSKCFKDPDVFVLHRRSHTKRPEQNHFPDRLSVVEKENLNSNLSRQETLRANPILANLLKSGLPNDLNEQPPNSFSNNFDVNNILSIENQIMTALAANMESYIRNLSSMLTQAPKDANSYSDTQEDTQNDDFDRSSKNNDSNEVKHCSDENDLEIDESKDSQQEIDDMEEKYKDRNDDFNHSSENNASNEVKHSSDENDLEIDESKDSQQEIDDMEEKSNHQNDDFNHSSENNASNEVKLSKDKNDLQIDENKNSQQEIDDMEEKSNHQNDDFDHSSENNDSNEAIHSSDENVFEMDESKNSQQEINYIEEKSNHLDQNNLNSGSIKQKLDPTVI